MPLALLLTLQAAAAPAAIDFDLARYRPSRPQGCGSATGTEIVVCGRRLNREIDPSGELARRYAGRPLKAEVGLGGGATARSYVQSAEMPRGAVSKRIMVGIKLPF
jgi:hypothetical protein